VTMWRSQGGAHGPHTPLKAAARLAAPASLLAASLLLILTTGRHAHQVASRNAERPRGHEFLARASPRRPRSRHRTAGKADAVALQPRRPDPGTVGAEFVRGWLRCLYRHGPCSRIPGMLAPYARIVVPQLVRAPVTRGDLASSPRLLSVRLVLDCPDEAVAVATYSVDGERLQLHPNLVLEPAGWEVFDVPEYPARIPLPSPLRPGERPC
jgi:hypothetical protein